MTTTRWAVLLSLAVSWTVPASPGRAQDAEKAFYAGKTVRMVVGSGTGGGYDVFSRIIAPYLARTLGTTVIVENQPGAGGLIALNRLYVAPPDGLQISLSNGTSAAFAQLTDQQGVRFDLAKFSYLATVGAPPGLWLVGPDSPIREVQQAIDAGTKWRWASSGGMSGLGIGAAFTCEALKLDCHVVQGYKGSADAGLAVTRGEMDALYVPESSANNFVKARQNWALATMSRTKSRFFPDRPTIFEAAKMDADGTWVMDFLANVEKLGRILIAPPGIPPARLAYLQEAVKQTLHNPQLIADGEKAERIIEYLDPVSTSQNAVAVVGGVTPEQKARVLKISVRCEITPARLETSCKLDFAPACVRAASTARGGGGCCVLFRCLGGRPDSNSVMIPTSGSCDGDRAMRASALRPRCSAICRRQRQRPRFLEHHAHRRQTMNRNGRACREVSVGEELASNRHERIDQARIGEVNRDRDNVLQAATGSPDNGVDGAEDDTRLTLEIAGHRLALLVDKSRLSGDPHDLAALGHDARREPARLCAVAFQIVTRLELGCGEQRQR